MTLASPDQQPSTSSSGTDASQHTTTTSEGRVSPVTERPSPNYTLKTYVPPPTDPALWTAHILDAYRMQRGPFKVRPDFNLPKGPDGRAFDTSHQLKTLPNGEK